MASRALCLKLVFLAFLFFNFNSFGQSDITSNEEGNLLRARAYYISAIEQYNNGNYEKTLEYCIQIEKFLDTVDPEVESLRVKSYYEIGDFSKAKISMDLFLRISEEKDLTDSMLPYIVLIDDKIREENQLFEDAKNHKSVAAYQRYLESYPYGRFTHEVQELLKKQKEEDSWLEAQRSHTIQGYTSYVARNPNGTYVDKAREAIALLDFAAYEKSAAENTQESLNWYLNGFPDGQYRADVKEKLAVRIEYDLYYQARNSGKISDYIAYVESYPAGRYVAEANQEIEEGLYNSGNEAFSAKNYHRAKTFFDRYETRFSNGRYIHDVRKKMKKCNRKIK